MGRSENMSRIRGKDTGPEMALRRAAWSLGLRYRLHLRIGKTRPDLIFIGARVVVFVDGCFWHCCPIHQVMPKRNRGYWESKLHRNSERDLEANHALRESGWSVLRFWEHDIERSASDCAAVIANLVRR